MQKNIIRNMLLIECPICHGEMHMFQEKSLVCGQRHCFDISKQGYVNFNPSKNTSYSEELFVHRHKIFADGFYQPLVNLIEDLVTGRREYSNPLILDAGCGEGYYSKSVLPNSRCVKLAFDISKKAVQLAAKDCDAAFWMVADLDNIPVKSDSIDVILNILAPANYAEFNRVLKKDGVIIKVIPGENYLIELRKLAVNQLMNKEYRNTAVVEYFKSQVRYVKKTRLSYQLPLNKAQAFSFAKMTPMMMAVKLDELCLDDLNAITIELDILEGERLGY